MFSENREWGIPWPKHYDGSVPIHSSTDAYEKGVNLSGSDSQLDIILRAWKEDASWYQLLGLRVLDIASGSVLSSSFLSDWDPQFSRICAHNGARVIALDINTQSENDSKLFTWMKTDLVEVVLGGGLHSLPILQNKQFDLIHSSNFVGNNPSPDLEKRLSQLDVDTREFEMRLFAQAEEILAEGGAITLDPYEGIYAKRGGKIVQIKKSLFEGRSW
jgi:SAM-dependent methyltransferase